MAEQKRNQLECLLSVLGWTRAHVPLVLDERLGDDAALARRRRSYRWRELNCAGDAADNTGRIATIVYVFSVL